MGVSNEKRCNKIKYQKRGASLSKMKNKNLDTAIRKLHYKYQPYGDNYKILVLLVKLTKLKLKII